MVKFSIFLAKHPDMSHEEFVHYHKNNHAPLFTSLPEVQQYVRNTYNAAHYRYHCQVCQRCLMTALPSFGLTMRNASGKCLPRNATCN